MSFFPRSPSLESTCEAASGRQQVPLKTIGSDPEFGTSASTATTACDVGANLEDDVAIAAGVLRFCCGVFQIPHPDKVEHGGEDAYFIAEDGTAVGVADGVSEWGWRFGLNPKDFAHELMVGARASIESSCADTSLPPEQRAARSMQDGFKSVRAFGAATALIATISTEGSSIGVANLGDSGLRLLRSSAAGVGHRVVERTAEQQHAFGKPFQLSRTPQPQDYQSLIESGKSSLVRAVRRCASHKPDLPEHAALYTYSAHEGDVLILGSDGLFDNLHDSHICEIVDQFLPTSGAAAIDVDALAQNIAETAFHVSMDTSAKTPYSLSARDAGVDYSGGAQDDITVLVAYIGKLTS